MKYDYDNCVGKTYNNLTILRLLPRVKGNPLKAEAKCKCGKVKEYNAIDILREHSTNCGCVRSSKIVKRNKTMKRKGLTHYRTMPEYNIWYKMKQRCQDPKNQAFKNYGKRGIGVCDRWNNSFKHFLEDMGERPSCNLTLDRIDNNKGYTPENCRWTDRVTQNRNQRTRTDNKTGARGVFRNKDGCNIVSITVNKNRIYLGSYKNLNEAKKVRKEAELKYWS